ncbi:MAG: hypothetical protein A3C93_02645 [Candidatus Lloydbacteria bacterium RIFCSPHIGHO2_02_FULL_54_17]|uniref:Uncharacterized protein n=1 Tax=Candidatus Lloydbacteria bacterium RIFCSPHIGHO2_02_FULL_54_17 TaxID=1798664 RepID=A0A1G2DBK4_9BACT|nr:MAG: hypothetical protein A2762_05450 [Candidatus Lloydbacteria bacterium RIFCSPHIGHO2_01_FULL_54_11]OGZ10923.1 MAG: hypothetical protein A3C93_02645 [Candidatus Lloydbacteria bacterium RIFCSPHIGHO2_02_FULL_54_17]OGZ14905.1 MAG: hypothetical protein A2948_05240 [Candidatus Lloydbacteria bacterium RIFCSPLOWO2_01_FULL_54_18]OGZ15861.1 MAG: hypothetical protein A3H76_06760 [Candidatus Lloydbacteria bacterium RIFCSPLOWO2_02_FULL_54_12]
MEKLSLEQLEGERPVKKEKGVDLGRRGVLEKLFGLGVAALTLGHPAKELVEETIMKEGTEQELFAYLERLKNDFGVEVDFSETSGNSKEASARELSLAEKKDLAENVYQALSLYPKEYIEQIGLRKIRGVKWMDVPRLDWYKKYLSNLKGYVDREHKDTLHLNKESVNSALGETFGWANNERMRYATHHELYHVADEHIGDEAFDAQWVADGKERGATPPDLGKYFGMRGEGYATKYGSTSPHEDRAEIAAMLLTRHGRMMRLAGKEAAIEDKITKIKEEFKTRSSGLIDGFYWELLQRGDAGAIQEYFATRRALRSAK